MTAYSTVQCTHVGGRLLMSAHALLLLSRCMPLHLTLPCKCCPALQPADMYLNACFSFGNVQDPSYDPFGFAKIATRTASSQAGAAAACPANVQKFFATLFARAQSPAGLDLINSDLNLCPESHVGSYTQVNETLAKYFQDLWVSGVSFANTLQLCMLGICNILYTFASLMSISSQVYCRLVSMCMPTLHDGSYQKHLCRHSCAPWSTT